MTITHASLFSGIGAPELAATWIGWQNLFNCEINPFCRQILNYWFPNTASYEDITKTDFTPWRGRVTVLSGGFPCQPFSHAGQRRGAQDDRYLWPQMLRAIREIQPAYVLGENVTGITSMVQPGDEVKVGGASSLFDEDNDLVEVRQQFVIETVCKDLESADYSVQPFVFPACAVGAPHRRDRVWFLARLADAQNAMCLRREGQPAAQTAQDLLNGDARTGDCQRHSGTTRPADYTGSDRRGSTCGLQHGAAFPSSQEECSQQQPVGADCPQDWWRDFPTQSPVCRGNDGIPIRLDNLSVPYPSDWRGGQPNHFARWRADSIKAYGNSMVPQVVYEIFRAIDQDIRSVCGCTSAAPIVTP